MQHGLAIIFPEECAAWKQRSLAIHKANELAIKDKQIQIADSTIANHERLEETLRQTIVDGVLEQYPYGILVRPDHT
jgi:hypothetical protein